MGEKVKIGLLGLGTVGSGVYKALFFQGKKIEERTGKNIEITKILVQNQEKERNILVRPGLLTTDFQAVLHSDIDILIEVMGGIHPAYEYIKAAILKGCHIITANKELMAKHGRELIELANSQRVQLFYEASVAGGIPVLSLLRNFLQTNDVVSLQGILNGTTNYILTKMEENSNSYTDALRDAQQLGFAEADPTADVEGYDPMYKLYILSQLAFGEAQPLQGIKRNGISNLTAGQLRLVGDFGYRIKLLAKAVRTEKGPVLSVEPTLIPKEHPLADVKNEFNGVLIKGNIVGDLTLTGRGAGELPTASAVVEDLAFLLTKPMGEQQFWKESQDTYNNKGIDGDGMYFVYIKAESRSDSAKGAKKKLLQFFYENGIEIFHQNTRTIKGEAGHYNETGLIVKGLTEELYAQLRERCGSHTAVYPVLSEKTGDNKGTGLGNKDIFLVG